MYKIYRNVITVLSIKLYNRTKGGRCVAVATTCIRLHLPEWEQVSQLCGFSARISCYTALHTHVLPYLFCASPPSVYTLHSVYCASVSNIDSFFQTSADTGRVFIQELEETIGGLKSRLDALESHPPSIRTVCTCTHKHTRTHAHTHIKIWKI